MIEQWTSDYTAVGVLNRLSELIVLSELSESDYSRVIPSLSTKMSPLCYISTAS